MTSSRKLVTALNFLVSVVVIVVAGCSGVERPDKGNETETPPPVLTSTEILTATEASTGTPTVTPTASETQIPTTIADLLPPLAEMGMTELEIGSRKVEFALGIEQGSNVFDVWKELEIVDLEINSNREDVDEMLSKTIEGGFWQAYLTQNKDMDLSYEDFVANLGAYKLKLIRFDKNNKREVFELSLDQIKRIEYRILDSEDPRLFINDAVLSAGVKSGYAFEDIKGTFVFYRSTKLLEGLDVKNGADALGLDETIEGALYSSEIDRLVSILVFMGYSLQISSPLTPISLSIPDYVEKLNFIFDFSDYPTLEDCKSIMDCKTAVDWGEYLIKYSWLRVVVEAN